MSDQPPSRYQPPLSIQPMRWGSLYELSRLLHRPYKTVYGWAATGTLADFGIQSHQDHLRRWWVYLPEDLR